MEEGEDGRRPAHVEPFSAARRANRRLDVQNMLAGHTERLATRFGPRCESGTHHIHGERRATKSAFPLAFPSEIRISIGRLRDSTEDHGDDEYTVSDVILVESARIDRAAPHFAQIFQSRRWTVAAPGIGLEHPHHSSRRL